MTKALNNDSQTSQATLAVFYTPVQPTGSSINNNFGAFSIVMQVCPSTFRSLDCTKVKLFFNRQGAEMIIDLKLPVGCTDV